VDTPKALAALRPDAQIRYGVVNPRTSEIESPDEIVLRFRELAKFVPPDRIFLNPDCGFGEFAEQPVADARIAFRKLRALSAAADSAAHSPLIRAKSQENRETAWPPPGFPSSFSLLKAGNNGTRS
jgi:methionine synthase II (cobalamin-independent)